MFVRLFKYPIVRHILAGLLIAGVLWGVFISPLAESNEILKGENESLREDLREIADKQHQLISQLAQKDTYKIQNQVDAKIKKGGEIKLIPSNDLKVVNLTDTIAPKVSVEPEKEKHRKHWWQLWRKRDKQAKKRK